MQVWMIIKIVIINGCFKFKSQKELNKNINSIVLNLIISENSLIKIIILEIIDKLLKYFFLKF